MKRTFFALALLVPALASAAVNLTMEVAHDDETASKTVLFSEAGKSQVVTPENCGASVEMTLIKEDESCATFKVSVKTGDDVVCEPEITLAYGEAKTVECPQDDVEASLKMTAAKVVEEKAE